MGLICADNVTVRYGDTVALDHVSFQLETGRRVAVVGRNGAGKSTLFKLIVGEVRPSSGTFIAHLPNIAYVPQHKQIDWNFPVTVADVVMMGRVGKLGLFKRPKQHDRAIVNESLGRVDMLDLADKQIGALSGGQKQRVFIARALAQEAQLMLFDEPLAGLDIPNQERFFTLLDEITKNGITAVVATHDLSLAADKFDQIMLLNKTLIAFGDAESVFTERNLAEGYGGHLHIQHGIVITDAPCNH